MASLQDIMNVDEDQLDSHTIKKDHAPAPSARHHQPYLAPSAVYNPGYATSGDQPDSSSAAQGKKRPSSSRTAKSTVTGTSSSSSDRPSITRRRSNNSADSMDQPNYGYGHAGSSSGGLEPSGHPMRPFGNMSTGGDVSVKLTPITGRVSRAKKGMKVHTCDLCRPPKVRPVRHSGQPNAPSDTRQTFTRAEHLR